MKTEKSSPIPPSILRAIMDEDKRLTKLQQKWIVERLIYLEKTVDRLFLQNRALKEQNRSLREAIHALGEIS